MKRVLARFQTVRLVKDMCLFCGLEFIYFFRWEVRLISPHKSEEGSDKGMQSVKEILSSGHGGEAL